MIDSASRNNYYVTDSHDISLSVTEKQEKSDWQLQNNSMPKKTEGTIKSEGFWDRVVSAFGTDKIQEIAKKTGVGYHGVRKWSDDNIPGLPNILTISNLTGSSIHWLLFGEGPEKTEDVINLKKSKSNTSVEVNMMTEAFSLLVNRVENLEHKLATLESQKILAEEKTEKPSINLPDNQESQEKSQKRSSSYAVVPPQKMEKSMMEIVDELVEKTGEDITEAHLINFLKYTRSGNKLYLDMPLRIQEIVTAYYEGRLDEYLQAPQVEAG